MQSYEKESILYFQNFQSLLMLLNVGVTLAQDKLGSAPKETRYQNITHVVEHDMRMPIVK